MKTLSNLDQALSDQLMRLFDAESQAKHALPKFITGVSTLELNLILHQYLEKIHTNLSTIEKICYLLEENPHDGNNGTVEELLSEARKNLKRADNDDLREALTISEIQRINHLLICDYGTATAYARALNLNQIASLLHQALSAEKEMDEKLSVLAMAIINPRAISM